MTTYWNFFQLNVSPNTTQTTFSPINSSCNVSTIPNLSFKKVQLFGNIHKNSWQSIHDLSHKFNNIYILDEMIFSIQLKQRVSPLKGFKFTTIFLTLILRCPKIQTYFFANYWHVINLIIFIIISCKKNIYYFSFFMLMHFNKCHILLF